MIRKLAATLFIAALTLTPALAQNEASKKSAENPAAQKTKGKTESAKAKEKTPSSEKTIPASQTRPGPSFNGSREGAVKEPGGQNNGGKEGGKQEPGIMNQHGDPNQGGAKPGDKGNIGAGNPQLGADVMILNVMKDDANAKPNPNAAGRLVPVKVEWKVKLSPGAKLMELEAMLNTTNTDNSMTKVSKMLRLTANSDTIMLPMPEGVFAKEFVLKINSKCATQSNRTVSSSQSKTGTFPVRK